MVATPTVAEISDSEVSRVYSPRPDSPEPDSRQGRRNAPPGVQLLDDEGSISEQFERCLLHIFAKYCTPSPNEPPSHAQNQLALLTPPPGARLTAAGLDKWATDTNGHPFSEETKAELQEFMDITEDGELTFKGFVQIYQLQTENDEEETWRDLSSHGFDRTLTLVTTRREDVEVDGKEDISCTFSLEGECPRKCVQLTRS